MSKREKILIAIALTAALGFVYFNYFLTPLQKKTQEMKAEIADNRIKAGEMAVYLQDIEAKKQELADVQARYEEKMAEIPAVLDQAELINEFNRIVSGHGDRASLIFMPAEQRAYYMVAPVNMKIFCYSYGDMQAVLSNLEDSDFVNLVRAMRVDVMDMLLNVEGENQSARRLDLVLTLDFLGASVNEIEPGEYRFVQDGTYGTDDLFKPVQ